MPPPQKPPMKLCWCTTEDQEDGFVVARSEPQAKRYHEAQTGHPSRAVLVCEVPPDHAERLGRPSDSLLRACGGDIAVSPEGVRTVRLAGKTFVARRVAAERGPKPLL